MSNQTIPAVTDEERMLAREWAAYIESSKDSWGDSGNDPWGDRVRAAAHVILRAVPAPPRPTLADMAPEERRACKWMQADVKPGVRLVITAPNATSARAALLDEWGEVTYHYHANITPRPDLPRLEWPGDKKPAPALPDGWRLADHPSNGRVIVTNPTPSENGIVYYVIPTDDPLGYDWLFCDPADLTYIAQ